MTKAQLYYQLVNTLKEIADAGDDPKQVTDHALRQLHRRVYSYERTAGWNDPENLRLELEVKGDAKQAVLNVLKFFRMLGNLGGSRGLSCEGQEVAWFDGDGADRILSVKVNGEDLD